MKKTLFNLKTLLVALGVSTIFTNAVAQKEAHCGTDEAMQKLFQKFPDLKVQQEKAQADMLKQLFNKNAAATQGNSAAAKTATTAPVFTYTIPIVFHIIHQYGVEDITDAQVIDQVAILNRDYKKLNADTSQIIVPFKPIAANTSIQFSLPTKDPQGNCTNGIDHVYSHLTNAADDACKINGWPQNKYLNIWVVGSFAIEASGFAPAGYAYYPSAIGSNPYMLTVDGVIILSNYIGSIGTGSPFTSRALTHEIGHYLGLSHTWGGTNSPGVACGDDGIPDTPITKGHQDCSAPYDAVCDITEIDRKFTFDKATTTSGATDTTHIIQDPLLNYSHFSAVNLSANTTRNKQWAFTNWATGSANHDSTCAQVTGSLDPSKYYEITLTPKIGTKLTISSVKFNVQRDSNGVRSFAVRSSVDGFTSNFPASIAVNSVPQYTTLVTNGTVINAPFGGTITAVSGNSIIPVCSGSYTASNTGTLTIPAHNPYVSIPGGGGNAFFFAKDVDTTAYARGCVATVPFGTMNYSTTVSPITFRIYGWNAENTAGSFRIDTVIFTASSTKIENVQNYMEYSYCSKMFTADQDTVMRFSLRSNTANRSNVVDSLNQVLTGINMTPACAPVADFKSNRNGVCQGGTVSFTALPRLANATSYNWTFSNGTPATSTSSVPTITFNSPGWQQVSLTVANSVGSNSITRTQYIYVAWPGADYTGPFTEDLETNTVALNSWIFDNPENNEAKWHIVSNVGYSGTHSFMLNNVKTSSTFDPYYDERLGYNTDALISPKYNLNFMSSINFSFKYSCATRGGTSSQIGEYLRVYKSTDCGASWINIYAPTSQTLAVSSIGGGTTAIRCATGAVLANAGYSSTSFTPNSPNQWTTMTIPVSFIAGTQGNVEFKIEYTASDVSNNIYIDDINISGTTSIEESSNNYFNLNVYPNPSASEGEITIDYFSHGKKVTISMVDMLGRQVYSTYDENQPGPYQKTISGNDIKLKPGMYFVNLTDGTTVQTKKIIIN